MKLLLTHPGDRYFSLKSLDQWGDKRFGKETKQFWRQQLATRAIPTICVAALNDENKVIGLSFSGFSAKLARTQYNVTIVSPDSRNAGVGKALLCFKLKALFSYFGGHLYSSTISSSNEYGLRMCFASGLSVIETKADGKLFVMAAGQI